MTKQAFTTGPIRKNSMKKIKELLSMSTRIVFRTQSRGLDDCYNANTPFVVSAERVLEWVGDSCNYRSMSVYLECDEQGNPTKLTLGGSSYWQDDFVITFGELSHAQKCESWKVKSIRVENVKDEQPKPRITANQVSELLAQGYKNPLHDLYKAEVKEQDENRDVKVTLNKIFVCWSESCAFNKALRNNGDNIEQEISLEEYERLEWVTLRNQKQWLIANSESGYGYDKTKLKLDFTVEIKQEDGTYQTFEYVDLEFRHDICEREQGLAEQLENWIDYVVKSEREEKAEQKRKEEQERADKLNKTNVWELLGISVDASIDEIKTAYRQLAKKYHPDVETGDLVMMQAINNAYKVARNFAKFH